MAEGSCCDVRRVEMAAVAIANPSLDLAMDLHFQTVPALGLAGQAFLLQGSIGSRPCKALDGDPPPRPRSLLSIQRI